MFVVGNGTDDAARSNAFEVYGDGHAELQKTDFKIPNSVITISGLEEIMAKLIGKDGKLIGYGDTKPNPADPNSPEIFLLYKN